MTKKTQDFLLGQVFDQNNLDVENKNFLLFGSLPPFYLKKYEIFLTNFGSSYLKLHARGAQWRFKQQIGPGGLPFIIW